jgi:hypothetical protein
MRYKPNPKCEHCSACHLVTETFCNVSRLDPDDYYYQCIADVDCLDGEDINILVDEDVQPHYFFNEMLGIYDEY